MIFLMWILVLSTCSSTVSKISCSLSKAFSSSIKSISSKCRTLNSARRSFSLCRLCCAASNVSRLGGLLSRTLSRLANRVIEERITPLLFVIEGMAEGSFVLIFSWCLVNAETRIVNVQCSETKQ